MKSILQNNESPRPHHIFYEITHPESGHKNYVLGLYEVEDEERRKKLINEINQLPEFRKASMLIIDKNGSLEEEVSYELKEDARVLGKPVHPLDSVKFLFKNKVKSEVASLARPSALGKGGLAVATAPVSFPLAIGYYFIKSMQSNKKREDIYMKSDLATYPHAGYSERSIKLIMKEFDEKNFSRRIKKWLDEGYDGGETNPTCGGLVNFLQNHNKAFIAVPVAALWLKKDSLVSQLEGKGFLVNALGVSPLEEAIMSVVFRP